ncbi:hypothetical protein LTR62_004161 [Meristemomyces frigidus]|uniref:Kinesin-like protein n=1 Tax=Meristemomyces frigidus TaxID=1508187 RepID=A0AAN7TI38_9PEZI|nr:hypothetical protein LTR62_004161 [Meristemomyces frigidus]
MEGHKPSTSLFDVYLRLRPSSAIDKERFLDVEHIERATEHTPLPTHITIHPPANDNRKRAVEKFAFTSVFEEHVGQREIFQSTGIVPIVEGVLGGQGREGRDGLIATLGVTGSGKSHTILGSKSQRGITQLTLDVLFQHTAPYLVEAETRPTVFQSICSADVSEGQILPAAAFLDSVYFPGDSSRMSRATTPAMQDTSFLSAPSSKRYIPRLSTMPHYPSIDDVAIEVDGSAEYAIVVSMYEVYNDRIYDLLTASATSKAPQKRRALLFKSTEHSPDRKVVAGLRKVICANLEEALLVLETGLTERRVAGTGSNAVSSRSHGFFCLDVKKRRRSSSHVAVPGAWSSSTLTIVDLAGSERARTAKTAGATLAEAGKINESLMYLGQCMQMQSDNARNSTMPGGVERMVPFRQCKLTELLFSNSFSTHNGAMHKARQKSIMIVTADPLGDFNATSQILRYSALAREVTVPRIPSVSATILATASAAHNKPSSGRDTPSATQDDLDAAHAELSRLRQELEVAQVLLEEETQRRMEAETSWQVAESRIEEVEAEIREEVFAEMEGRLEMEKRRWRAARDVEMDAQDDHLDRKLELLSQQMGGEVYEDHIPGKENVAAAEEGRCADLEDENAVLKEKLANAEREREVMRSPSKKMRVLKPSRKWNGSAGVSLDDL